MDRTRARLALAVLVTLAALLAGCIKTIPVYPPGDLDDGGARVADDARATLPDASDASPAPDAPVVSDDAGTPWLVPGEPGNARTLR